MAWVAESVNGAALAMCATPQVFTIEAIKKHGGLTTEDLANAVNCMMGDLEFASDWKTQSYTEFFWSRNLRSLEPSNTL